MADIDPLPTERESQAGVPAELMAAGFADPVEIGRGGFGVVYRCHQRALDRTVAVKVLTTNLDADNVERFVREQVAMGKLSGHPHIVNIFQVGTTASGRPYIVMQYHPHGSLEQKIHDTGRVGWQDALHVGVKVAGALETAHRRNMLHRDVKPGNILLTEYGEPQLADFGIARISGGFETTDGTITGSPAYTAPEVLRGRPPDETSDVYSLAATLFAAATGHAVFERRQGENMVAQFLRITRQPMPPLQDSGLPDDVSSVIGRAMAPDPGSRPATAADFGEMMRDLQRNHCLTVDDMAVPIAAPDPRSGAGVTSGTLRPEYRAHTLTPPAPATRFRLPAEPRAMVERDRLIAALRAGEMRKLTVIHGPTGFGKSTLAAQWAKLMAADGVLVPWLTVDLDDNNVVWFLSHLIEAIRTVTPELAAELGEVLEQHGDEAERYVLTSLINDIHRSGRRMTLVIDDWHLVTDSATVRALRYLLDNQCSGLRVVVTSRTKRGLPMSRMRMQDELVEIDATALRFDTDESEHFLIDVAGLDLDRADVEELASTTEGWVAALQLASLSLRDCDDPAQLIGTMTGRHHAISEFLAENVLDTLEPSILDFLLATAVAEKISGGLASALSGRPDGLAMLEQIEERDLFLRRIDDQWFSYHDLFVDFLRHRLSRADPNRVTALHRIAAQWFVDHHMIGEAVDHALAAGDEDWAATIVENRGDLLLEKSQMATAIGLVDKLPVASGQSRPRVQLIRAWATIMLHRGQQCRDALARVDSALAARGSDDEDATDLRVEADVVRAVVALRGDRIGAIDRLLAPCFARADRLQPFVVGAAATIATYASAYRGDVREADRLQDWAQQFFEKNIGQHNVVHGLCYVALAHSLQLELDEADAACRKALRIAKRSGGRHSYNARLAASLLGALVYERGNIEEADRLLDEGYKVGPEGGSVDFKIARYVVAARIKAVRGDRLEAMRRIDEAARIAHELALPRLAALAENERIRLGLPAHPELGAVPLTPYDARRQPVDEIDEITVQHEEGTAIRSLLADDDPARRDLACRWAEEWVVRLESANRPRALFEARRLLVACLFGAGRRTEAKAVLAPLAAQAARLGVARYLIDGGAQVVSAAADLRADRQAGRWHADWPDVPAEFLDRMVASPMAPQV